MFVDKVKIKIKAGNGGDGHMSFHTEKFVANGGPDGGDGGKGGDLIMVATDTKNTLIDFYYHKHFYAPDGLPGERRKCYGKKGKDMILQVPLGTVVRDCETGNIVADFVTKGESKVILRGGRGGLGNAHFANSRRQAPRFYQKGELTVEHAIELELKSIADMGLVGFPNVGKSTLLSVISAAKPKIANYHFTTLSPNLGVVNHKGSSFLAADIPGLIEGAADGAGLGHEFLRHIERTRMLVHVIDISSQDGRDPIEDFHKINAELGKFSDVLKQRPQIIALNKCDALDVDEVIKSFLKVFGKIYKCIPISAATGFGVQELLDCCIEMLSSIPKEPAIEYDFYEWNDNSSTGFEIEKLDETTYEIRGGLIERIARNVRFDDYDSMQYFHKTIKAHGIEKELRKAGATNGDTIIMQNLEFEFVD